MVLDVDVDVILGGGTARLSLLDLTGFWFCCPCSSCLVVVVVVEFDTWWMAEKGEEDIVFIYLQEIRQRGKK